jgi:hypothetical protein
MFKLLLVSSIAVTALFPNAITKVVKHEIKSDTEHKLEVKDKPKKDGLNLEKKEKKMERKMKAKAVKSVL